MRIASVAATASLLAAALCAASPRVARGDDALTAPAAPEVVKFHKSVLRGDSVRVELDPSRSLATLEVVWNDRAEGARASFEIDGVCVARRFVGDHERQEIEVRRKGALLLVKVERANANLESVAARYAEAAPADGAEGDAADAPMPMSWISENARVVSLKRTMKSGDRVRIPAAFSGMKIREVRVRASATDFRGRLKLLDAGPDPITALVAKNDTAVFATPSSPDDTKDMTLVMDFRGAVVEDVTIFYDPLPEPCDPARAPAPAPAAHPAK